MPKVTRKEHVYTLAEFERCLAVCERYMPKLTHRSKPPRRVEIAWEYLCSTPSESEFLTMKLCQRALSMHYFLGEVHNLSSYWLHNMESVIQKATHTDLQEFYNFAFSKILMSNQAVGAFGAVCFRIYTTQPRATRNESLRGFASEHVRAFLYGNAFDEEGEVIDTEGIEAVFKIGNIPSNVVSKIVEVVLDDPAVPMDRKYECTSVLYGGLTGDDSDLGPLWGLSAEGIEKVATLLASGE